MAEQLTPEHFHPHLDKVFRVQGGRHALTLAEVQARQLSEAERKVVRRQDQGRWSATLWRGHHGPLALLARPQRARRQRPPLGRGSS